MDNINNINNITFVKKVIKTDYYNYVLEIDITNTSNNIKDFLLRYQSGLNNLIKLNIKPNYKYKIIDDNNNFKYELLKNINFNNKLIKINLEFLEKYSNFYIKELIVFDKKEDIKNKSKYNINKTIIVRKINNIL